MPHCFKFHGRAKRSEYWGVIVMGFIAGLFSIVIPYLLPYIAYSIGWYHAPVLGLLVTGYIITLLTIAGAAWAITATAVRRLRDIGLNVLWVLLIFVPYVGLPVGIALGCIPSHTWRR